MSAGETELRRGIAVLDQYRANIETLAQLTLTIEDELKQREFSNGLGEVYSAQNSFHTKLGALIQSYEAKCESLKPSA